jgi:alpha-galactosidase
MEGSLGVGANLNKWTPQEFATARRMIAQYKTIRRTVQRGLLYRLMQPIHGSEHSASGYVARNGQQVVVFAFLHSSSELYPYPRLHLRGLDPAAMYHLAPLDGEMAAGTPPEASGAWWMYHGVDVNLVGDFQAAAFTLQRVP